MPGQTGPKTAEGKARSSKNAVKHGLTSDRMFVLANETPEVWNKVLAVWIAKLAPADEAELMIVTDMAHAQWLIRRARIIQSGMLDMKMSDQFDEMAEMFEAPVDEVCRLAHAFKDLADKSEGLQQLHRYESRYRRAFKGGLDALNQLRAVKPAVEQTPEQWGGTPVPRPVSRPAQSPPKPPAKRPAAQQFVHNPQKLQNEIRRERIRRVRITFGNRVPIRLVPPKRRKCL